MTRGDSGASPPGLAKATQKEIDYETDFAAVKWEGELRSKRAAERSM